MDRSKLSSGMFIPNSKGKSGKTHSEKVFTANTSYKRMDFSEKSDVRKLQSTRPTMQFSRER